MFRLLMILIVFSVLGPDLPESAAVAFGDEPDRRRRVVLVYQAPDGHPVATHEYEAGIRLIGQMLKRDRRLSVAIVSGDEPWDDGPQLLDRADVVFLFVSQGGRWIQADARRLAAFQAFAKRGGGLVCLHWGMGTREADDIQAFVDLFGGCHGGPDRKYKVVETQCVPHATHPIMAGIEPFQIKDEFYYRLKLASDPKLTSLLKARIEGQSETVAWAWQRPDDGRSFGFSGLHFHKNWSSQDYRRMVVQGVLWTARLPIPKGMSVRIEEDWLELPEREAATQE